MQGFLEDDLKKYAAGPGVMVITLQHYGALPPSTNYLCPCAKWKCSSSAVGFDGFSNGWYNVEVRSSPLLSHECQHHLGTLYSNGRHYGIRFSNTTLLLYLLDTRTQQSCILLMELTRRVG